MSKLGILRKNLKVALLIFVAMVFLVFGCATSENNIVNQSNVEGMTYTYVDIDPIVIGSTWEQVANVPLNMYIAEIYFRNPDQDADIQFATLVVTPAGVAGYSYMLNGKIDVLEYNDVTNAYESVWDTLLEESRQVWHEDYNTYFSLSNS